MSERSAFAIHRRVAANSRRELDLQAAFGERFPRHHPRFRPLKRLAVTLIERGVMQDNRKLGDKFSQKGRLKVAASILLPHIVESQTTTSLWFDVGGVDYLGRQPDSRSVAVMLADPEKILARAVGMYARRISNIIGEDFRLGTLNPHVTLFELDETSCTREVRTWTEDHVPKRVLVGPVSTDPRQIMHQINTR